MAVSSAGQLSALQSVAVTCLRRGGEGRGMSSGRHRGPPTPQPGARPGPGQQPSGCQVRPKVVASLGPTEAAGLGGAASIQTPAAVNLEPSARRCLPSKLPGSAGLGPLLPPAGRALCGGGPLAGSLLHPEAPRSPGPLPAPPRPMLAGCETHSLAVGLSTHRHGWAAPTPPGPRFSGPQVP